MGFVISCGASCGVSTIRSAVMASAAVKSYSRLSSKRQATRAVESSRLFLGRRSRGSRGVFAPNRQIFTTTSSSEPCYVTTPIYYVNDKPHIGHVYTSTLADVYARFQRSQGRDVRFLTGTDEHGQKVEQSAEKRGIEPQQLADENSAFFRDAMENFGIEFDDFIRTTDPRHKEQVTKFIQQLKDKDFVYLGEFEGWYDEGQEEYVTESTAAEQDFKSAISGKPLVKAKQENYFFRLSAFQDKLEAMFEENPDLVLPKARSNEVLNRIKAGLQDVPISRTSFTWGIPMPDDEEHVIYVWIDALFNYISALQLAEGDESKLAKYWPATVHIMAKEIVWFHAVIWPAVLMALELPLPGRVYAHGFWIRDGKKMSKSLGNFVDLETLTGYCDTYGLDSIRYFLLTQGPIGAIDSNWSDERLYDIYSDELVNTLGNCASRTTSMINKYYKQDGVPSEMDSSGARRQVGEYDWPAITQEATNTCVECVETFDLPGAATTAVGLVGKVDTFISETEPFRLAKDESKKEELAAILYQCMETVRIAGVLLESVMPEKMGQLEEALGTAEIKGTLQERTAWGQLQPGSLVKKVALFPRVDPPTPA
ncbi:hypothetical protein CYMTET_19600 [Cymbomonas tetramitiformis]|uniref:methionine--tRNA ligase n=1 Tax=Cymbomonas tetramitiformis TaxID=36881 RepID=A0AAE0G682_9CHLO|nr:hypothetical protein CYMTET_19600 [Cymbomonas tetramitiformis]